MKIKLIIVLMSLTIVGYSQNKTVESIEKQVEEFYVKFEKLDQSKQRIESNKLVNFLNTTDSKTRELWIAAMDKHEKALKEKSTSKSTELKINVTAFSEIPEELQGCSFVFSKSKEAYLNNKFLYFDDMGKMQLFLLTTRFKNSEKNQLLLKEKMRMKLQCIQMIYILYTLVQKCILEKQRKKDKYIQLYL